MAFLMFSLTFATAFKTDLPLYISLLSSLSSNASRLPVEAPDGEMPLPSLSSSSLISTSTVGFPLESSICLPFTSLIFIIILYLLTISLILTTDSKRDFILFKLRLFLPSLSAMAGLG